LNTNNILFKNEYKNIYSIIYIRTFFKNPMSQSIKDKLNSLNIPINQLVFETDEQTQERIFNYLSSMNEKQKKTYLIAFNHLGTSFNVLRSNGYKEWNPDK